MGITIKQYKKILNTDELGKSKKTLRRWFNLFIRLRDLSNAGLPTPATSKTTLDTVMPATAIYGRITGKCIACGKIIELELFQDGSIMNGRSLHASHFFNTDKYPNIEFYEDNVHLSCARCNSPYGLHGNKEHYQTNLIKKIRKKGYEALILAKNTTQKLNILDIDRMIFEYKDKSKIQANRLGIKI